MVRLSCSVLRASAIAKRIEAFVFSPPTGLISSSLNHKKYERISLRPAVVLRQYASRRFLVSAKYKVEIATLGKKTSKDATYDDAIAEYAKRMHAVMHVTERQLKRDNAARALCSSRDSGASLALLDVGGVLPRDSVDFARIVFNALQEGRSRLTFVIGDADGFPDDVRNIHGPRIHIVSLSTLTLTHKMVSAFRCSFNYDVSYRRRRGKGTRC